MTGGTERQPKLFGGIYKVAAAFALLASVVSIVNLARHGFEVGLYGPFEDIADEYEHWLQLLVGSWLDPLISVMLGVFSRWTGMEIQLFPHWMHIFVVMWLYFGASAKTAWGVRAWGTGAFYMVWGGLVALGAGITAGAVPLLPSAFDLHANFVVIGAFVYGIFAFDLGRSAWGAMRHADDRGWLRTFVDDTAAFNSAVFAAASLSLFAFWFLSRFSLLRAFPSPGLAFVAMLAVLLALYYVYVGLRHRGKRSEVQESPLRRFRDLDADVVGVSILVVLGGATLFLLSNAGLHSLVDG